MYDFLWIKIKRSPRYGHQNIGNRNNWAPQYIFGHQQIYLSTENFIAIDIVPFSIFQIL